MSSVHMQVNAFHHSNLHILIKCIALHFDVTESIFYHPKLKFTFTRNPLKVFVNFIFKESWTYKSMKASL